MLSHRTNSQQYVIYRVSNVIPKGDQDCPAAVTLPVMINSTCIVDQAQQDAYCNGFIDGHQAASEHPGVRSHVSSSMVLPHNVTGFSDIIKIMPNGSAAEIGRPHIINQTHIGSAGASINPDVINTINNQPTPKRYC
jgi:hypothetical protein